MNNKARELGGGLYIEKNSDKFVVQDTLLEGNMVEFSQNLSIYNKKDKYLLSKGGAIYMQLKPENQN